MKKWIITVFAILALVALGLTSGTWVPRLLGFVGTNKERITSLKDLAELLSKLGTWLTAIFLFVWRLWKDHNSLEITLDREAGGKISKFNVQLNDLLVAPYGIVSLVDKYASEPTEKNWKEVKKRAKANHDKLENLYKAMAKLEGMNFFGENPKIPNDIHRVIDAKMHMFYQVLDALPSAPTDPRAIDELRARAHDMEEYNARVANVQQELSKFIKENRKYLRKVLRKAKHE